MISWLLALLASSQVPYELLALVVPLFVSIVTCAMIWLKEKKLVLINEEERTENGILVYFQNLKRVKIVPQTVDRRNELCNEFD